MNPDPDADVTFQFNQIQLTDADADVTFGSVELTPKNDDVEELPENEDSQQFTAEESSENADVENGDDDVTFNVSQVQKDSNSQQFTPENDDVASDDDDVTFGFNQIETSAKNDSENADVDDEDADVDREDDDVEGEEFTFMCINSDNEITELTEKTVFPLFDQTLLYNNFNEDGKRINVPVDNVFIESPRGSRADATSSSSSSNTTLTAVTDLSEMNIKSNSTGFSKLWRFRDSNNINRSNSDGRDAFVFLNNPKTEGKGKGKGKEEVVVVKKKVKKANVASAHEVYLKQKGGEEEFKRKSYLPYRPGLMGFFTNVNGGLSKNVHPF